jgi:hypothetical protein
VAAFLLVVPTMFISMFFGLGPPPETPALWVATAIEQQVRFIILIISGIFFVLGFAVMRESLKDTPGSLYGVVGFTAVMVAIPLFIFNMIFWGAYLPQLFKMMTSAGMDKTPEWFKPLASQFNLLTPVETAIRYLGIAAFAVGIYKAGWFNKKSSFIYIAICLVEFAITVFPNAARLLPVPFFIVTIPANPFIVAFYIGINLLRKFGGETK